MLNSILKSLIDNLEKDHEVVMVTVLATQGSTPRKAGSQMLVKKDLSIEGSIGGGLVEGYAISLAEKAFQQKKSFYEHFSMDNHVAAKEGMACGGKVDFLVQYINNEI